jgi:RHH-type proline utilization regulon transcriptional repressor/proline dehydrogenase/delta 1-pyrroline-5-carboxylate dehydrogenase
MTAIPDQTQTEAAVDMAAELLNAAVDFLSPGEKRFQKQMAALLSHAGDKAFLTELIDQCFRSKKPARAGAQISYLFKKHGIPEFFPGIDRILLRIFLSLVKYISYLVVPLMVDKIRKDSSHTIISGEPRVLRAYLSRQNALQFRTNLNHLGEAVLGEAEARSRLNTYLEDLAKPETEEISVKISSIYSQVNPLAFDHTVDVLKERLRLLYRTAATHMHRDRDGRFKPKFVTLDMEAYHDLEITSAAFCAALDGPEFLKYSGGIALQAYLPESYTMQEKITGWARKRIATGGVPIKIRLVKGANMEMEQVTSALQNWPLASYSVKVDTDANYKKMISFGLRPENIAAVHLGIASHNLFDIAFAFKTAEANHVSSGLIFEMLTGMADHITRAVKNAGCDVLLYAPYTDRENFINAIAYLVRRLEENSGEENFLRHAFNLTPAAPEWTFLKQQFEDSCERMASVPNAPYRTQNRLTGPFTPAFRSTNPFVNEPDTDWSLSANRKWADDIRKNWKKSPDSRALEVPLVIAGREVFNTQKKGKRMDPSLYKDEILLARYVQAAEKQVEEAVDAAHRDPDGWRTKSPEERHESLAKVAQILRQRRGDLIGAAVAETGKIFQEADVEVSEAVDMLEYYPRSISDLELPGNLEARGKGVGVVISPWNFPIAIPCGGIAASLAAGNTVIFKPSSDAVLTGWVLCCVFWDAGITRNTLQFLPCHGTDTGKFLINQRAVDYVILTGGTRTGLDILKQRPDLFLAAETGGKNATIVTALSDRDQAVNNIIISAFGNCGQKCSATSLLILEKEVYEDLKFKKQLVDAARSLGVGSAWEFQNRMGPLIHPPNADLLRAMTSLEQGETWALQPRNLEENPHLWTPGIKYDVTAGSYTHLTEFFGPLLAVMCAENLEHAITLVNQTGYGLTSGLESLDEREHEKWKEGIRAGNLYINRSTTGAITLRQPFGGMGKSALGPGIKTGGPNYVTQFMTFEEKALPGMPDHLLRHPVLDFISDLEKHPGPYTGDLAKSLCAAKSYLFHAEREFIREKDFFRLRGQDNIHRYIPVEKLVVRVHADDSLFEILARITAGIISGCDLLVSIYPDMPCPAMEFLRNRGLELFLGKGKIITQSDELLIDNLNPVHRIRYAAPDRVPGVLFRAAAETGIYIARTEVLMEGRLELLHYFRNQSVCYNYHRYGSLGRYGLRETKEKQS